MPIVSRPSALLIAALAIIPSGCASSRFLAPDSAIAYYGLVDKMMSAFGESLDTSIKDYYRGKTATGTFVDKAAIRNEVITAFIAAIDLEYEEFTASLLFTRAGYNTLFDTSAIGLGAASVLTEHVATAKLLAGLATAVTASRVVVDKNFFFENTAPIVQQQMDSLRKTARQPLVAGLAETDKDYPLGLAIAHLNDYYLAGTLAQAFAELAKSAQKDDGASDAPTSPKIALSRPDAANVTLSIDAQAFATTTTPLVLIDSNGTPTTRSATFDKDGKATVTIPVPATESSWKIVIGNHILPIKVPAFAPPTPTTPTPSPNPPAQPAPNGASPGGGGTGV